MNIRKLLIVTSILEIIVGLTLILLPSLVAYLLFGVESSDIVNVLGRFIGIALMCLGLVCWQGKDKVISENIDPAVVRGMFAYNFLAAIFFIYVKLATGFDGAFLVLAAVLHSAIAICFIYLMLREK